MLYLVIGTLAIVVFSQLLRAGQGPRVHILPVTAVNYVVAAAASVSLAWASVDGSFADAGTLAVALGVTNGTLYFTHLMLTLAGFRLAGVGITTAITMSASIAPVLVAWVYWGETMSPYQWAAVAMQPFAMILMRPPGDEHRPQTLRGDVLLFFVFFVAAVINVIHKWASLPVTDATRPVYQACIFSVAAVCAIAYALISRQPWSMASARLGAVTGLVNAGATLAILAALGVLKAAIVFPTSSAGVIILNMVIAAWLWGERLKRRQMVGLGLAVMVVVLANISDDPAPVELPPPADISTTRASESALSWVEPAAPHLSAH